MACVETVLFVLLFIFYKERKEEEVEESQMQIMGEEQEFQVERTEPISRHFINLMKNRDYVYVMISSSVMVSLSYSFPTLLEQLILPYGFTSEDASVFGMIYNLLGIVGGICVSIYLSRRRNFGGMQIGIIIGTSITFALIWFLIANCEEKNSYWWVFFAIVINGAVNIGIYSSCFEYAVAITPEYGEALSAGCINCLANTLGFAEIILF